MCIKINVRVLRNIFNTTYKGEILVEIYTRALHLKLVIFQQSRNFFRYFPENEMEVKILVWNPSKVLCKMALHIARLVPPSLVMPASFYPKLNWLIILITRTAILSQSVYVVVGITMGAFYLICSCV